MFYILYIFFFLDMDNEEDFVFRKKVKKCKYLYMFLY